MLFLGKEGSREEVCRLALSEGANRRELCRRFRISPTTLYTLLGRYRAEGAAGLVECSRRPHRSPSPDGSGDRAAVLAVRCDNPVWGGREIAGTLRRQGRPSSAFSTVAAILRCHGEPSRW